MNATLPFLFVYSLFYSSRVPIEEGNYWLSSTNKQSPRTSGNRTHGDKVTKSAFCAEVLKMAYKDVFCVRESEILNQIRSRKKQFEMVSKVVKFGQESVLLKKLFENKFFEIWEGAALFVRMNYGS